MSLRRRLLLLIVGILFISLLGGALITYRFAVDKVDTEMSSAVEVGAKQVREALTQRPPDVEPRRHHLQIVQTFEGERHLQARLIDASGNTVLETEPQKPKRRPPGWLLSLFSGAQQIYRFPTTGVSGGQDVIELRANPENEINEAWDDAVLKFLIVGGFCTLVVVAVSLTLNQALKPLDNLSQAFARIGKGDFATQVPEQGPEEFTEVFSAFNRMSDALAIAEAQNIRLETQLAAIQEEERAEIARDLHDEFGPFLFAVDADAQTIPVLLKRDKFEDVESRAGRIRRAIGHMQTHLRDILGRLRPATMLDQGLGHAVETLSAFWQEQKPDLTITVDIANRRFSNEIEEVAYRIFQEGMSNAVRHGAATHVTLGAVIAKPGKLRISIVDNGTGLPKHRSSGGPARGTANSKRHRGFGLIGMRERVDAVGGHLSVQNRNDGGGVALTAFLPIGTQKLQPETETETENLIVG